MREIADLARKDPRVVVGLISGTSADGIDAALVEIQGWGLEARLRLLAGLTHPLPQADREELFRLFEPATGTVDRICRFNFRLGELFAEAALAVIARSGRRPDQVDLIGSHGQTVWHIPAPAGATLQIGEPAVIAERTGLPVVADFRVADIAAGGHGAPLVPYFDLVVFRHPTLARAVQNIGGIANVTYLPAGTEPAARGPRAAVAFDTGPGNMLIDETVRTLTGGAQAFDRDGAMAIAGRVDEAWLAALLDDPYLHLPPPKSTGREVYGRPHAARLLEEARRRGLVLEDIVATVSALTADSIVRACRDFLVPRAGLDEVVLCGGGAYNAFLRRRIAAGLSVPVRTCDEFGVDAKLKEAMAFALLASEAVAGRPTNVPAATGAAGPRVLGKWVPKPAAGRMV
ncbi:MAG: anhydro-N-acetylmuramic acid kinase [Armatimonadota bacterium]|nr:anhydro-N-acetylmuramic acid kinase [Armatimonadota bacterium]MDR7485016.1 anhydro-N-acetylmuramic acid kinase [Armatimonadota bacterium]MDR7533683.1 anhydro-N-acetylmuramic acid kinase [Armatimonadota bacterium]MDR7535530.1 anhydro-N-acetylmuramic acid kinase [Armatimonadota bacterium]